jgi:hypothetical protein
MDAVADYESPERERRDDRAPAERDQTHRDVPSDHVAERDARRVSKAFGDRGPYLLGFGTGEEDRKRECAHAEPRRRAREMFGEGLRSPHDSATPTRTAPNWSTVCIGDQRCTVSVVYAGFSRLPRARRRV